MSDDDDQDDELPGGLTPSEPKRVPNGRGYRLALTSRIAIAQAIVARIGEAAPQYIKDLANQ